MLKSLGYKLKEGPLDAADYGVLQRRLRLVLLRGWALKFRYLRLRMARTEFLGRL